MRLLLDTHVFLWWSEGNRRVEKRARDAIRRAELVCVSAASAWEAAIKSALGRLEMRRTLVEAVAANRFSELPITMAHAAALRELDPHHTDPFDRMLIAQARTEGLILVTHDRRFKPYPVQILWT